MPNAFTRAVIFGQSDGVLQPETQHPHDGACGSEGRVGLVYFILL